jgi:hypothetical protein
MNHLLKKRFILVLALFVSLLPFRFSYGLTVTVPDLQQKMHQHIMDVDCPQPGDNAHCLDMTLVSAADENCCSDQCDSSFGAQPGVAIEYGLLISSDRQFQAASDVWTTGPIPPTLLRPPPARS